MNGGKVKVLLIDDSKDYLNIVKYLLASTHKTYKLDHTESFVKGLDIIKLNKHDVYLVDENLNPGKGIRLIEKAIALGINKPLVLLAEQSNKMKLKAALDVGVVDVLDKNKLTADVLDKTIQLALTSTELTASKKRLNLYFAKISNLSLLARTGSILASKIYYEDSLKQVAQLLVKETADWCLFVIADKDQNRVIAEHIIPEKNSEIRDWVNEFPPDVKFHKWPYSTMKSGQPTLYSTIDRLFVKKISTNTKEAEMLRSLGFASCITAPIAIRDSTVGIVVLTSAVAGRYDTDDLDFVKELAVNAGYAIDRTWQVARAKKGEDIFKRLVQSNTIGIVMFGIDGAVLGVNDVMLNMLGYKREEVVSPNFKWVNVYPSELHSEVKESLKELMETGIITTKEREFIRKDKKKVPVLVGGVLLDKEKGTALALIVDISARKEIEKHKDEFISIASHELKTPLTSQKLFIEIIQKEIGDKTADGFLQHLNKIKEQNDKLIRLVNDLLDVSKMEAGRLVYRMEDVDLLSVIRDIVDIFRQTKGRKIILSGEFKDKVYCDSDRIVQVVGNLIQNSIRYSPENTNIIVRLLESNKDVTVCVRDHGVGIANENQKNIFKRYFREQNPDKSISGFGLGLYISHEIVKAHKGKIWLTSKKGKGSQFCFSLPKKL